MYNIKIRGITIEQMNQLVEMVQFFYGDENTHVYQDPDFLDNVVITSTKGDNYNQIGWYQVCFDVILPKIIESNTILVNNGEANDAFNIRMSKLYTTDALNPANHPVEMLYTPFLAIKQEKDGIDNNRKDEVIENTPSKT